MSFDPSDVVHWERVDPPLFWPLLGNYVIADRHLPDGTRQHMIHGHVSPGVVLANAQIVGEADCQNIQYSSRKSHLSRLPGDNSPVLQIDEGFVMREAIKTPN